MILRSLVGGLEHDFYFPYIANFIIPTDFHIFQRGRYTTNQLFQHDLTMHSDILFDFSRHFVGFSVHLW